MNQKFQMTVMLLYHIPLSLLLYSYKHQKYLSLNGLIRNINILGQLCRSGEISICYPLSVM